MTAKLGRLPVPAMGMAFHYYHKHTRMSQRDQLGMIKDLGFDIIQTEESPVAPERFPESSTPSSPGTTSRSARASTTGDSSTGSWRTARPSD